MDDLHPGHFDTPVAQIDDGGVGFRGASYVLYHRFETLQHASRVIGDWIPFYNHQRKPPAIPS